MTLALPGDTTAEWLARFTAGLAADQAEFGIGLLGGDTTQTPGPMALSVTALGRVPSGTAPLRRGAKLGDQVWVSGSLGDGALGLGCLRGAFPGLDRNASGILVDRYRLPQPRLGLGIALRTTGLIHAAIDVSDGLMADLGHICEQSGCGADIELDRVPVSAAARAALRIDPARIDDVLAGGDDYGFLFTAAADAAERIEAVAAATAVPLARIGRITEGGGVQVRDAAGKIRPVARGGYTHF